VAALDIGGFEVQQARFRALKPNPTIKPLARHWWRSI